MKQNSNLRGRIIVIDSGTDGAGKQTQTTLMKAALEELGEKVHVLSFPDYEERTSELVKMYLSGKFGNEADDVNAYAASTFFAVDRIGSYLSKWKNVYEEGGIILTDRYVSSNMIYQGAKLEGEDRSAYINWLDEFEHGSLGLPRPDMLFYLDVPPMVSKELRKDRPLKNGETKDIHEENEQFMNRCYEAGKEAADRFGWLVIRCSEGNRMRSPMDIHSEMLHSFLSAEPQISKYS